MSKLTIMFNGKKPSKILEGVTPDEFKKVEKAFRLGEPILIHYSVMPGVVGLWGTDNNAQIAGFSYQ